MRRSTLLLFAFFEATIYLICNAAGHSAKKVSLFNEAITNRSTSIYFDVEITCPVNKSSHIHVKWIKPHQNIPMKNVSQIPEGEIFRNGTANTSAATLRINPILSTHEGWYVCVAWNKKREWERDFGNIFLQVDDGKTTVKPVVDKIIIERSTHPGEIYFHCLLSSGKNVTIQWFKEDPKTRKTEVPKGKISLKTDFTPRRHAKRYNISKVSYEDKGIYTCVASNILGSDQKSINYTPIEADLVSDSSHKPMYLIIVSAIILGFSLFCIVVIITFRKSISARLKSKEVTVVHWVKTVTIQKREHPSDNSAEELLFPEVKIEKIKVSKRRDKDLVPLEYKLPQDKMWEFPRERLTLHECLGEGNFGRVMRAKALSIIQKNDESSTVAVKMLKDNFSDTDLTNLVQEMEIMKMMGKHENVLSLLGCCTQNGPLYVIVEYAEHGNLRDFLRKHRPPYSTSGIIENSKYLTQETLITFAYQIARGMEFLASKKCVHRDLAARNILLSQGYVVKIADFGLARDIQSNEYYKKMTNGQLPIRWMAPECLFHGKYSTKSDVWSFGILLWEIMTFGENPYPKLTVTQELPEQLRAGYRMESPPYCPSEIYVIMRCCWLYDAAERLSFSDIVIKLDSILKKTPEEEDYNDFSYSSLRTSEASLESDFAEYHNSVYNLPTNVTLV